MLQLFGETRAGRPYSYTAQDATTSGRLAVYGTVGNNGNELLYVPDRRQRPDRQLRQPGDAEPRSMR